MLVTRSPAVQTQVPPAHSLNAEIQRMEIAPSFIRIAAITFRSILILTYLVHTSHLAPYLLHPRSIRQIVALYRPHSPVTSKCDPSCSRAKTNIPLHPRLSNLLYQLYLFLLFTQHLFWAVTTPLAFRKTTGSSRPLFMITAFAMNSAQVDMVL